MSERAELIAALASLPEWTHEMARKGEDEVYADTAAIHVFLPMTEVKYFLVQRDVQDPEHVRYFGLCDLGLGFPELGWVEEDIFLREHDVPMFRLGTEIITSKSEFIVSNRSWTLAEGYTVCGLRWDDAAAV